MSSKSSLSSTASSAVTVIEIPILRVGTENTAKTDAPAGAIENLSAKPPTGRTVSATKRSVSLIGDKVDEAGQKKSDNKDRWSVNIPIIRTGEEGLQACAGSTEEKKSEIVMPIMRVQQKITASENVETIGTVKTTPTVIKLIIHSAKDLPKKDLFGKPDPYVVIQTGQNEYRSEVKKSTRSPEWEFALEIDITNISEMNVKVMDKDKFSKDDLIGESSIDVKNLMADANNACVKLSKGGKLYYSISGLESIPSVDTSSAIKTDDTDTKMKEIENKTKEINIDDVINKEDMERTTSEEVDVDQELEGVTTTNVGTREESAESFKTARSADNTPTFATALSSQPSLDLKEDSPSTEFTNLLVEKDLSFELVNIGEASEDNFISRDQKTDEAQSSPVIKNDKICLTIHSAENLPKQDLIGKLDPYVVVECGEKIIKSEVKKNTSNPIWELMTEITLSENTPISITVFDKDKFTKDDKIGGVELDPAEVERHGYVVMKKANLVKGGLIYYSISGVGETTSAANQSSAAASTTSTIVVSVTSTATTESSAAAATATLVQPSKDSIFSSKAESSTEHSPKASPLSNAKSKSSKKSLKLTIHKARSLEKKDIVGKSDPFIIVSLGDQFFRSETVKNNHNPDFDFKCSLDIDESRKKIMIEILDEDVANMNELIGKLELDPQNIKTEAVTRKWYSLTDCKSGEILLSANVQAVASWAERGETLGSTVAHTITSITGSQLSTVAHSVTSKPSTITHLVTPTSTDQQSIVSHSVSSVSTEQPSIVSQSVTQTVTDQPSSVAHSVIPAAVDMPSVVAHAVAASITDQPSFVVHSVGTTNEDQQSSVAHSVISEADIQLSVGALSVTSESNTNTQSTKTSHSTTTAEISDMICLTIHSAENLPKRDLIGKLDPYVVVKSGEMKIKSEVKNNTSNPVWELSTEIMLLEDAPISITLFDKDRFTKDDKIGEIELDPLEIKRQGDSARQKANLVKGGILYYSIGGLGKSLMLVDQPFSTASTSSATVESVKFASATESNQATATTTSVRPSIKSFSTTKIESSKEHSPKASSPSPINEFSSKSSKKSIKITIHKARNLEKKDIVGRSDPFIIVSLDNQFLKSETVKNNHNPDFDFKCSLDIDKSSKKNIMIEVLDEDVANMNELIGKLELDPQNIEAEEVTRKWFSLSGCKSGEILLSAKLQASASKGEKYEKAGTTVANSVTTTSSVAQAVIKTDTDQPSIVAHIVTSTTTSQQSPVAHSVTSVSTEQPSMVAHSVLPTVSDQSSSVAHSVIPTVAAVPSVVTHIVTSTTTSQQSTVAHSVTSVSTEQPSMIAHIVSPTVSDQSSSVAHSVIPAAAALPSEVAHAVTATITDQPSSVAHSVRTTNSDKPSSVAHSVTSTTYNQQSVVAFPSNGKSTTKTKSSKRSSTPIAEKSDTICLTIHSAENLPKQDLIGKLDPYVVVKCGEMKIKSDVKKNTSNPVWELSSEMKLSEDALISITVFDKDRFTKDDKIGEIELDPAEIKRHGDVVKQKANLVKGGIIYYSISGVGKITCAANQPSSTAATTSATVDSVTSTAATESSSASARTTSVKPCTYSSSTSKTEPSTDHSQKASSPSIEACSKSSKKNLKITIHKARNLEKKDFVGKSDPFIIVSFEDQFFRSETVKNNHSPNFDFKCSFNIQESNEKKVMIEVLDEDVANMNELIGRLELDTHSIETEEVTRKWFSLDGCKSGEILLSAKFQTADSNSESGSTPTSTMAHSSSQTSTETSSSLACTVTDPPLTLTNVSTFATSQPSTVAHSMTSNSESSTVAHAASITITQSSVVANSVKSKVSQSATSFDSKNTIINLVSDVQDLISSDSETRAGLTRSTSLLLTDEGHQVIYLTIHSAKNLTKKDVTGKSDPYVSIKHGSTQFRSPTKNNTSDPEWNFEVDLIVKDDSPITVTILDEDKFTKDDVIGEFQLQVKQIFESKNLKDVAFKLPNGGIIIYSATSQRRFSQHQTISELNDEGNILSIPTTYSLPSGENVLISHSIHLPAGFVAESVSSTQTITKQRVSDKTHIESIGKEIVSLEEPKNRKTSVKREIVLPELLDSGVKLPVTETKTTLTREKAKSSTGDKIKLTTQNSCMLELTVHEARHLEKKDIIGISDPFLIVSMNDQFHRSQVVKNEQNPKFNYKCCFVLDNKNIKDKIRIEVLDEDAANTNQLIGQIELDPSKLEALLKSEMNWVNLAGGKSGGILISARILDDKALGGKQSSATIVSKDKSDKSTAQLEDQESENTIKLTVHSGSDLINTDLIGKSDPYVVVNYSEEKFTSKVIKNNLNPVWEFSVDIPVHAEADEISISVFDKDIIKDDNPMGIAELSVNAILSKAIDNKCIKLENCESGSIYLSASVKDKQQKKQKETSGRVMLRKENNKGVEPENNSNIKITVHEIKNLEKKDMLGKSDPFLIISMDDQAHRSKTVQNNSNPVFNFTCTLDTEDAKTDEKISIEVFDEDSGNMSQPIGKLTLDPNRVKQKRVVSEWLKLADATSGDICVSAKFEERKDKNDSTSNTDANPPKLDELKLNNMNTASKPRDLIKKETKNSQTVKITVHHALDLENTDIIGKSDPYAIVKYQDTDFRSKTIKNNLNPVWEFIVILPVTEINSDKITVLLFDEDKSGEDDSLGKAEFTLGEIFNAGKIDRKIVDLENCKRGQLCISFETPATLDRETNEIGSQERNILMDDSHMKPANLDSKSDLLAEVHLVIHKAVDLENKGFIGKSDPYVLVKYADQEFKSQTVNNSQNPEWDFAVDIRVNQESTEKISIVLMDKDIMTDDFIGSVDLDPNDMVSQGIKKNQCVDLEKCKSGKLYFSFARDDNIPSLSTMKGTTEIKRDSAQPPAKQTVELESKKSIVTEPVNIISQTVGITDQDSSPDQQKEMVQLIVHRGSNLINTDIIGKSDPYVIVKYQDKEFKSLTVQNNLNPIWEFKVDLLFDKNETANITVSIFDEDKAGKDDPMGSLVISSDELFKEGDLVDRAFELKDCESGMLHLSLVKQRETGVTKELLDLKKQQEELAKFIPEEILKNLPPELSIALQQEISEHRLNIIKDEDKVKGDESLTNTEKDTNSHEQASEKDVIKEIFDLVSNLDEPSSKFVYEKLASILAELDDEVKKDKLEKMKEELIQLQIEQFKLIPNIPEELKASLPPEMIATLERELKTAYISLAGEEEAKSNRIFEQRPEKSNDDDLPSKQNKENRIDSSTMDELIDMQLEQNNLLKNIQPELLANLSPEMQESVRLAVSQGVQDLVNQDVKTPVKPKDSRSNSLKLRINYEKEDVTDDDVSLPPTPAVAASWATVTKQPARPHGPLPTTPTVEDSVDDDSKKAFDDTAVRIPESDVKFEGPVVLRILRAKELEKMDLFQKCDPFVIISYKGEEYKTDFVKNTYNPSWEKEIDLRITKEDQAIQLKVVDWERIGKNEPMGELELNIPGVMKATASGPKWFKLKDCKSGSVLLSLVSKAKDTEEEDLKAYSDDESDLTFTGEVKPYWNIFGGRLEDHTGAVLATEEAIAVTSDVKEKDTKEDKLSYSDDESDPTVSNEVKPYWKVTDGQLKDQTGSILGEVGDSVKGAIVKTISEKEDDKISYSDDGSDLSFSGNVKPCWKTSDGLLKDSSGAILTTGEDSKRPANKIESSKAESDHVNSSDEEDLPKTKEVESNWKIFGSQIQDRDGFVLISSEAQLSDEKQETIDEEAEEENDDVTLPPTPSINTPWSVVVQQPVRPHGPTPSHSGAESPTLKTQPSTESESDDPPCKKTLFPGERLDIPRSEFRSVSPEVLEVAQSTVTDIIEKAKEKVIQLNRSDDQIDTIEDLENVEGNENTPTLEIEQIGTIKNVTNQGDETEKESLPSDVEEIELQPEEDAEESIGRLSMLTDAIRRKVGLHPKSQFDDSYRRTIVKRFASVEEMQSNITEDINDVRLNIRKRKIVTVQKTIITIVETVSKWLDNVEYKILKVKQISSTQEKKIELKNIRNEIEIIEETVDKVVEVTEMAVEIMNHETTITSCVNTLREQVRTVKSFCQQSEDELEISEDNWEEFLEGIKMVESLVIDLKTTIKDLEEKDEVSEESVETLSELETSNKGHRNKLTYLMMTGKGLESILSDSKVPDSLGELINCSKDIEVDIQRDREKIINLILSKQDYEDTLNEFEDVFLIAETFFVEQFAVLDLNHLNGELERRKKFFLNLSHCLQILDSNKDRLGDELKTFYNEKHQSINIRGYSILQKGCDHIYSLDNIITKWSCIITRRDAIVKQIIRIEQDLGTCDQLSSKDVETKLSLLAKNLSTLEELNCDITNIAEDIETIKGSIESPELNNILSETAARINSLLIKHRQKLAQLHLFSQYWERYETTLTTIQTWLAVAEDQDVSSNNGQLDLLNAEMETYSQIETESNATFYRALDILELTDEELQRRLQTQLEERLSRLDAKLKFKESHDEPTIAAIEDIENSIANYKSVLDDQEHESFSEEEMLTSINKLNYLLRTIIRYNTNLQSINNTTDNLEILERTGAAKRQLSNLHQLANHKLKQLSTDLQCQVMLREGLQRLEKDIGRQLGVVGQCEEGLSRDYTVLQRVRTMIKVEFLEA